MPMSRSSRHTIAALSGLLLLTAAIAGAEEPAQNRGLPAFADVRASYRPSDLRLVDRQGDLLHSLRVGKDVRRFAWVELEKVAPVLVDTVLRAEDRDFYRHGGVDVSALLAAAWDWVFGRSQRGGSTIPMQVAGLLDPSLRSRGARRSLLQKWRQVWAARALQASWSKEQILEAYLNLTAFRGEIQGVGAASALLFGKLPHGLSEAEGCVLASLLKGPNSPLQQLQRRASNLCGDVAVASIEATARSATQAQRAVTEATLAPHLAHRLLRDGVGEQYATVDARLQQVALASLRSNVLALRERNVRDGAVLVVDNSSGEVLAYVGGVGAELASAVHVDGVRARRQAGSTLKPFLYQLALEQRLLTAASLIDDEPLELTLAGNTYRPQSYDGRYRGLVSVRTALAGSLNIPAVRTLEIVGEEAFVRRLRQLGFEGLAEAGDFYGPSLALGSAEVTLWELVNAYRSLANGGRWSPLHLQWPPAHADRLHAEPQAVLGESAAFVVADILSDRDSRATTFGTESVLATPYWSAVKTGTSKEMRDNWCVGFSSRYSVGVWIGNLNGEPMHDVSGVAGAAPVWREVMDWLHAGETSSPPGTPRDVEWLVSNGRYEWFLPGTQPRVLAAAARAVQITKPVDGATLALDPDIPESLQRVVLQARGAGDGMRWVLDGIDLGSAEQPKLWKPSIGRHEVMLRDGNGSILDRAVFRVRGLESVGMLGFEGALQQ